MPRTKMVHTPRRRNKKENSVDPSDPQNDSCRSGSDNSSVRLTGPSVNLVAKGKRSRGQGRQGPGQGGKSRSHSQRAMETGKNLNLIAKRRQVQEQGGNTALDAQTATKSETVDANGDLIVENTVSAQRTMEIEMVESNSNSNSIARHGLTHGRGGKTELRIARVVESEPVDSDADLIARTVLSRGRGGRGRKQGEYGVEQGTGQGTRGTRSRPSKRRVGKGEQSKETSNCVPSSKMIKRPSSVEGQAASMKKGSPSREWLRSCRKTILLWLIDGKLIEEDEKVCYMDATKKIVTMTGRITKGGILCGCCQRVTSVWTFEKHAGSDLRQPYEHIYLRRKGKGRKSLQECQIAAWQDAREQKRRCKFLYVPKETDADQNDDVCIICGDGGDLICCDKCPSAYHPSCMNMEMVPQNVWLCPYCVCKYCGQNDEREGFTTCSQCDKKFHEGCFKEFSNDTIDPNCSQLYCGLGCREIFEKLEVSLGIRNDIFANYSWRVIHRMDMTSKMVSAARNLQLENNSKVAVTWMLMNETFETITDRHTGINVVQSIVYSCGSNLTRINFSRFYMFVLEKDDKIIAAASIRFHGREIAEMPFIATEEAYRGKRIGQELMRVIESFLRNLKVEKLIIPSTLETSGMWKRKYNFTEVSKELEIEISSYNIVMFPCAIRLSKDLSASITDSGDDIEDKINIKNDMESQTEHNVQNVGSHQED